MASDKITVDRELFERLTHAAIELEGEWHWKAGEMRRGHADQLDTLASLVREAVAIRDAPPQMMTDGEREIWTEAGIYEAQLQAAAQRLRQSLADHDIGTLDVVEAVDQLVAKHAKARGKAEDGVKQVRGLESVLATVCERVQVALGETDEIEILDVVEKIDVLLARYSHAIAEIREAQPKIIKMDTQTDVHADLQLWRDEAGDL